MYVPEHVSGDRVGVPIANEQTVYVQSDKTANKDRESPRTRLDLQVVGRSQKSIGSSK